jgi:hypothetical protein
MGAWDGTRQWSMYAVSMGDAPVQTVNWSNGRTDRCVIVSNSSQGSPIGNGSSTFKEAQFNAFTANACNIKWPKQDAVYEPDVAIAMFAGEDLQVYAGVTPSLGAAAGTTTVSGIGFQPDVVIFGNYGGDFSNAAINSFNFAIGCALADGTQKCTVWRGATLQSPTSKMTQSIISNRASAMATVGAAGLDYTCLINNFGPDGFDVVTDASASNAKLGFLALKLNGLQAKLWEIATPAATGVQADNTPNFRPVFGMTCTTGLTAYDTPVFDDQNGNGLTLSAFSNPYPWVISVAMRINVVRDSHTNFTANSSFQRAIRTTKGDNGELCNAINPTFTATGWTLNYIITDATPRMGWALAIEEPPPEGNISQTLPSPSQCGFAYCGTPFREYRVLTGNGTFTVPDTWNNSDYKFEGISGGQPGDTALVTRNMGGDGGCGAPWGFSTHLDGWQPDRRPSAPVPLCGLDKPGSRARALER